MSSESKLDLSPSTIDAMSGGDNVVRIIEKHGGSRFDYTDAEYNLASEILNTQKARQLK